MAHQKNIKINSEMIRQWLKDHDTMTTHASMDIFGKKGNLPVILNRGVTSMESLKKIAAYTGISEEELTDETRMETSTGKVLYKPDVPLPEKVPPLTRRFLQECVDRTDKTKTDIDKIFPVYQWYAMREKEIPKPRDIFIETLRSQGVGIVREYGRVYAIGCKPYKHIELRVEKYAEAQAEEQKKALRLPPMPVRVDATVVNTEPALPTEEKKAGKMPRDTRLEEWAVKKYLEGEDKVDILDLLKMLREVR